jgi:hypothetical protein
MAEGNDDCKKKALALVTIPKLNRSGISCRLTYGGSSKRTRLLNVGSPVYRTSWQDPVGAMQPTRLSSNEFAPPCHPLPASLTKGRTT